MMALNNGVQFETDREFESIPDIKLKPRTLGDDLLKIGIVSTPGGAAMLLGFFASLLVVASFYLLVSSVPPPPELGSDVLRSGETVPSYAE